MSARRRAGSAHTGPPTRLCSPTATGMSTAITIIMTIIATSILMVTITTTMTTATMTATFTITIMITGRTMNTHAATAQAQATR